MAFGAAGCAPLTAELQPQGKRKFHGESVARSKTVSPVQYEIEFDEILDSDVISNSDFNGLGHRTNWSLDEIVSHARAHHPRAIASSRKVDQARSRVKIAAQKAAPEFVFDVDTPLYDDDQATEISTRLTVPLFDGDQRANRVKDARAAVWSATATHESVLRQLGDNALASAMDVAYLAQLVTLLNQSVELASQRSSYLNPENRSGDVASNVVDYVNAMSDLQQLTNELNQTKRDHALARVDLAQAMGLEINEYSTALEAFEVDVFFSELAHELPPISEVLHASVRESQALAAARAAVHQAGFQREIAANPGLPIEAGPRYQNELGDNGDTVGVRVQTDLPVHQNQRVLADAASIVMRLREDEMEQVRHEVIAETARVYREVQVLAEQLREEPFDDVIRQQQAILDDPVGSAVLSGEQRCRIAMAINRQQRQRLELQYRHAVLRSKLRLHSL